MRVSPPPAFRPPAWARGPHLQTVIGARGLDAGPSFAADAPDVFELRIELDDGDALVAHAWRGSSGLALVLFHGLGGCADSSYVRRVAAWGRREGHTVVAVNHRGCGAGRGLARHPYHAGRAADIARALAVVGRRFPGERRLAIGFSISANMLLLLLGRGGETLPEAAIAVHPPVDLARCCELLHRPSNRIYDLYYTRLCLRTLRERAEDGFEVPAARLPWSAGLRDFDAAFTAPLSGFSDVDDYYRRCSSRAVLATISRPTVVLASRDDPYVDVAPWVEDELSSNISLHLEARGGHMGYVARGRGRFGVRPWLDEALAHYVCELEGA